MRLKSSAFKENGEIPVYYTGEGDDVSPPLEWFEIPVDAKQLALICEDPDAPSGAGRDHPFTHWLIYNIPAVVKALPEGVQNQPRLEALVHTADQGMNSFGKIGYAGPMPPVGHGVHHYIFRLYALDAALGVNPGVDKKTLLAAMRGHVLDRAELVGKFERQAQRRTA